MKSIFKTLIEFAFGLHLNLDLKTKNRKGILLEKLLFFPFWPNLGTSPAASLPSLTRSAHFFPSLPDLGPLPCGPARTSSPAWPSSTAWPSWRPVCSACSVSACPSACQHPPAPHQPAMRGLLGLQRPRSNAPFPSLTVPWPHPSAAPTSLSFLPRASFLPAPANGAAKFGKPPLPCLLGKRQDLARVPCSLPCTPQPARL